MDRSPHGSRSVRQRRLLRESNRIFLAFLCALLLAVPGYATLPGSGFEGHDGNLTSDGLLDWADFVGGSALRIGHDEPSGQTDDALRGKEDDEVPDIVLGSIPQNKSDLLRFYVLHRRVEDSQSARDLLHVGWVRANSLGTANMDFEFNQSNVLTANGSTPERTPGDFLITFAFASGANQVNLGISRWTETGPCESANQTPCWSPIEPLIGFAEAAVNSVPVVDPIEGLTLSELTFGEAVIDLTEAGVFDRESCTTFGNAYVKSRSSDSFTASMKDYIRAIDVSVSNCASIRIVKDAIPDDSQPFDFSASAGLEPSSFALVDDGIDADASSTVFTTRSNGTYSISESTAEGWDLAGIECSGTGAPELDSSGDLTGTVELQAVVGETIECTFTNTKRGQVIVDQETVPGGDTQPFDFFLTGGAGQGAVNQAFVLTDASAPFASDPLRPGTYSVTQLDPGLEWDPTSMSCDDGSAPDAISLEPGETVTCRFVNTKRGTIFVDNVTTPPGDSQAFDFTLTGGPSGLAAAFSLTDSDPPFSSALVLPGSGYAIGSALPAGWLLDSSSCSDGSSPANVVVDPGETVICTYRHIKMGRVVVDKATVPGGDSPGFDFDLTGGPDTVQQGFLLADAEQHDSGFLAPGSGYVLSEILDSPDWDLTGIACSSTLGDSVVSIEGADPDSQYQTGDDRAVIDLAVADTVRCTFTNTERGSIVIVKDAIPDDPQDFDFTVTGPETLVGLSLDDDGDELDDPGQGSLPRSATLVSLLPGSYSVSQSDPGIAWDATSIVCSDSSGSTVGTIDLEARTAGFELPPGERITCVFTDTKRGAIQIEKFVVSPPIISTIDLTAWPFQFNSSFAGAFTLRHGEILESDLLRAGEQHNVSESVPPGWQMTSTCLYPDGTLTGGGTGNITVPAGAVVHCTFYNEMVLHPGSSGFWRNWRNHYVSDAFLALIAAAFDKSPIYVDLFDGSGDLVEDAVAIVDSIYDHSGGGTSLDEQVLRELTTVVLNLAVSKSPDPEIRAMQRNDTICEDCIVDFTDYPAAEQLIRDLGPELIVGPVTVGDVVALLEAQWTGSLPGSASFDGLLDAEKTVFKALLGGFNHGSALIADPSTYPDAPGCYRQAGLPDATSYAYYSALVEVSGGTGPYTWELVEGALPSGLYLDPGTGEIYGTPDTVGLTAETYTFSVRISDSSGVKSTVHTFTITVHPPPMITTIALPNAVMGEAYWESLTTMGGTQPIQWSVVDGALPQGLSLDALTGVISGTPPTTTVEENSTVSNNLFTLEVLDMNGATDYQTFTLAVYPTPDDTCSVFLPLPTEAAVLTLDKYGSSAMLFWDPVPDASGYDALQGDLGALHLSYGDIRASVESCLAEDVNTNSIVHSSDPASREAYWFLVRGRNCKGSGTLDSYNPYGTQIAPRLQPPFEIECP